MKSQKNLLGLVLLIAYFLLTKLGSITFSDDSNNEPSTRGDDKNGGSKSRDRRQIFSDRKTGKSNLRAQNWSMENINRPKEAKALNPVVVAVVDTGMDINHPSLKGALWTNPGETGLDSKGRNKSSNGIDDDRNGYVDDVHGWNFASDNNNLFDDHGHGTHISGLIAAQPTTQSNFQGVSGNAKIMVLKYYGSNQSGKSQVKATIEAFRYAIQMGAKIINYSAGGNTPNPVERAVVEKANRKGILLIAAAGNLSLNTDESPYFPASYDLNNIVAVAGHSSDSHLFDASNFGPKTVDLSAPGENVYSTFPGGGFGSMSGTSQATALVTGVAALILGQSRSPKSVDEIKVRLSGSGNLQKKLEGKVISGRSLSAKRALYMRGNFSHQVHAGNLNQELLKLRGEPNPTNETKLDWAKVIQKPNLNRAPSMEKPEPPSQH